MSAGCLGISFGSFCPQIGMNIGGFIVHAWLCLCFIIAPQFDRDMIILMQNFAHLLVIFPLFPLSLVIARQFCQISK